jgi:hypothetical protein
LKPLIIETQHGLGDNIYSRAFVKRMCEHYDVFLKTPFTEVYHDLNLKFIKCTSALRTQNKNIQRSEVDFVSRPSAMTVSPRYTAVHLTRSNMFEGMSQAFGVKPHDVDLPKFECPIQADKPICVIRPATLRKEWFAASRNPDAEYIYQASLMLMDDYYVVSVADIDGINEHGCEPMPKAHLYLNGGELSTSQLIGLIQGADLVVGGVGFIVPMCIASKVDLFCILGGNGGYNHPSKITDPRMDLSKAHFCEPDNYCMCTNMKHNCNKTISNFNDKFRAYLDDKRTSR